MKKMLVFTNNKTRVNKLLCLFSAFLMSLMIGGVSVQAQSDPLLAESYPDRYTVVEGDTLWDISSRFLRDPWRWPEVWQGNPQVENPDLIYPGDVLVMTWVDGRPVLKSLRRETVKLSPTARATPYDAIPLIDPAAIAAYINSPLVTDDTELSTAPYVVSGYDNRLVMGQYDKFYARRTDLEDEVLKYRIFRRGRQFIDPISGENLGWEAKHIGDANMMRNGDPAKLVATDAHEEIAIGDLLRPIYQDEVMPFLAPKAPDNDDLEGVILSTENKAAELGALSVIAINLGEREGVKAGNVFRILSQRYERRDPVTGERFQIPQEKVGIALVFRTFEKVSFALITDTNQQVRPGDSLVSPKSEAGK